MARVDEELEQGDMVWLGFHNHVYSKFLSAQERTVVSMNIAWVILLSRCGSEGWGAVEAGTEAHSD